MIDNNLSGTIHIFCFCALFSNICYTINFTTKNLSNLFLKKTGFLEKIKYYKIFLALLQKLLIH